MFNNTPKTRRTAEAKQHTYEMEKKYEKEIRRAVNKTWMYTGKVECSCGTQTFYSTNPNILFLNTDTVSAIFKAPEDKVAVLNFASYRHPGGGYINGAMAQEEALCAESFLYNVLKRFNDYYEWNNARPNDGLYLNRALYSPSITFERGNEFRICDVITCAAPNYSSARKRRGVAKEENTKTLTSRISFIKQIAESNKVDTLLLGAYGCGVFGQDPVEVARLFKKAFAKTNIKNIIYAVPGNDKNVGAFSAAFGK